MENGHRNTSPPISTKFGDIVGFVFIRCKKIRRKLLTGKELFGGFCGIIGSACHY
jgi:hypothetical protein